MANDRNHKDPSHFNADILKRMTDTPFEGILAINTDGVVIFSNRFFLNILDLPEDKVIGHAIWDIMPGCRLYDTILEKASHWGEHLSIKGKNFLVTRFPIKQDGRIVGAVVKTIFPDKLTAKGVAKKVVSSIKFSDSRMARYTCMDIIGESPIMLYIKKLARRAARTDSNLLIVGESGTGKEIFAQAIHNRSVRRQGPFIEVNCAAIPETLFESELFGYVGGAFTGARKKGKPGKFELANGGTIFLDEIGDMPLLMQAKLLRIVQEKKIERVGDTRSIPLDVRILAATNHDLPKLVAEYLFREDLYYRLRVLELQLPSLRERRDDIPALIDFLILHINRCIGSDIKGITPESLEMFLKYDWPGNVRELKNLLEQAMNWSDDPYIDLTKLPVSLPEKMLRHVPKEIMPILEEELGEAGFHKLVEEKEKEIILNALNQTDWNKSKTARLLNMQRSVLYKKLKKYDII